jgi:isopentenyl-diphosphate Delta-isomerase
VTAPVETDGPGETGGPAELVVLLDDDGRAAGTADKREVHHADTPLHLAFSCYVLDHRGRVLLTRRALSKRTFPGVWTNTCCGHPGPGEPIEEAVVRRLREELGLEVTALRLLLPGFRYRAEMDGVRENEMCPVFVANALDGRVRPDPAEVEEISWEDWARFRADVLQRGREVSSWCREQLLALPAELVAAPTASRSELPAAAR